MALRKRPCLLSADNARRMGQTSGWRLHQKNQPDKIYRERLVLEHFGNRDICDLSIVSDQPRGEAFAEYASRQGPWNIFKSTSKCAVQGLIRKKCKNPILYHSAGRVRGPRGRHRPPGVLDDWAKLEERTRLLTEEWQRGRNSARYCIAKRTPPRDPVPFKGQRIMVCPRV